MRQLQDPSYKAPEELKEDEGYSIWDSFQPGLEYIHLKTKNQIQSHLAQAGAGVLAAAGPIAMAGAVVLGSGVLESFHDSMNVVSASKSLPAVSVKQSRSYQVYSKQYKKGGAGVGFYRPTMYKIAANKRKRARYLGPAYA